MLERNRLYTMSSPITDFHATQFVFTVRFDQGYRYLDRCGEALVRLENTLDRGWIPTETTPTSGQLRNYTLGLWAQFNVQFLSVIQTEFLSFKHFSDQGSKIYDILCSTFEIQRVFTPGCRIVYQLGFAEVDGAEQFLFDLQLCPPDSFLLRLVGGAKVSLNFTVSTQFDATWQKSSVSMRRRIEAKVVQQDRQPIFDDRIMLRLPLVSSRYRDALDEVRKLRREHSKIVDVAVQFDFENSIESELNSGTFDLPAFLQQSHDWAQDMQRAVCERVEEHD